MTVEVGDLSVEPRNGKVVVRRCHARLNHLEEPHPLWRDVAVLDRADASVLSDDLAEAIRAAGGV